MERSAVHLKKKQSLCAAMAERIIVIVEDFLYELRTIPMDQRAPRLFV